ncbi:hypothetical protein ACS0TY_026492 [Phlomoides rotata]
MANSFDSDGCGAGEVQRSVAETTLVPLYNGNPQSSQGSSDVAPADTANSFDDSENNGECGVDSHLQEPISDADDAFLVDKHEMGVPVIEEPISAVKQEVLVKCLKKCATEIDGAELIELSVLESGKLKSDGDDTKTNMKLQELKDKKEKKPRRRGGKARKNNEVLNCYSLERKEKKGLQYSREEMVALRFEKLEEQKVKWIEVYCGLGTTVAEEYDRLAKLDKVQHEDSVPSFDFDFDPRLQFQKSANLGEECPRSSDNHLDNMNTLDSSSLLPVSDETGFSVVEEEFCEDEDSDEDYSSIQRPAFLVTGEPNFDSGPPQDGLEFLRRVRWEAARIPKIKVAKFNKTKEEQRPYMPQIPGVMKCPENLLPLKEWEDSFLADFTELRQAFTQLDLQGSGGECSTNLQSVQEHILNQMLESNTTFEKFNSLTSTDDSSPCETPTKLGTSDAKSDPNSPKIDRPTLSKILKMDSAARTLMLKRRISSIENMSRLSHNESLWLFALCVAVDCPLNADTSASVRSLLRKCASLRAAKAEVDDEVIILNILVTISGRYFGQLEK